MRILALALAATLALLTGCGGADEPTPQPAGQKATTAPATKDTPWGQPVEVTGHEGGKLRITPIAVMYSKGAPQSDKAENGWFAIMSLRIEAIDKQDRPTAPISGGGWEWRGSGQTISTIDGNATGTAWIGAVPEFGSPIEPGDPREGIETFDVPEKGGRLIYLNPGGEMAAAWQIPASDQGDSPGIRKVKQRIKLFS